MKLPAKYKGATPGPWAANEGQSGCWFIWNARGGIQTENLIATFNGRINADHRDPNRAKADALLVRDAPMLACRVAELEEVATLAQRVLSSLTDQTAIKQTTVLNAYAQVREAELRLRTILQGRTAACVSSESPACAVNDNAETGEEAA